MLKGSTVGRPSPMRKCLGVLALLKLKHTGGFGFTLTLILSTFQSHVYKPLGCLGRADKSTEFKLWRFCSAECGFESRSWHLCPWARHFTVIASLHPGVNGYLWGQSWFLWWISLDCSTYLAAQAVYSPGSWDGLRNGFKAQWPGVIMLKRRDCHWVTSHYYYKTLWETAP